jgi:hypothetical protein
VCEDDADEVPGVRDVQNNLQISEQAGLSERDEPDQFVMEGEAR